MNTIPDDIDFDAYFRENTDEGAKVKPASAWVDGVIDRLYGDRSADHWIPTGFDKMAGKFDLRPGEVTLWAGINKHGKTTFLSQVVLNLMRAGQKACVASMEMKPADSMLKMTKQAAGVESPSAEYVRAFGRWTDGLLWIYDHLGRLAAGRVLALATYVRKELGIDHLVVDSLMKCGIGVDDLTGQKDFVDGLCSIARDTGLHIHLVCHMRKGENERLAPGKFDIKGAGEITDLVDNINIVWKNLRKAEELAAAMREKDIPKREAAVAKVLSEADSYVRVAGQRHHPFEGSFAFWFDKGSQQFLENQRSRTSYLDLQLQVPEAA